MLIRVVFFASCAAVITAGCGGRTQIDLPLASESTDAGADAAIEADAAHDAPEDTLDGTDGAGGAGGDAEPDGAAGSGGGGPIACLQCIGTSCPSALECLQDSACRDGAVCVFTKCLAGGGSGGGSGGGMGGMDMKCVLGCFNGDLGAGMKVFQTFQCVMSSCGSDCASLLGGGGIPGLPGGGSSGGGAPKTDGG